MKKALLVAVAAMTLAGAAVAQQGKGHGKGGVKDWKDLKAVHNKIVTAIKDMERARAANHYDMDGHGAKAEELLRQAENELKLAEEWAHKNGEKQK
jgi:hypothetical protein